MRGYKKIDLNAVESNFYAIKRAVGGAGVICVIKANAYGHGAKEVAKKLTEASGFAVATIEEAEEIRSVAPENIPVILLGCPDEEDISECIARGVRFTVGDEGRLVYAEDVARKMNVRAYIHLAVNTGMNRYGAKPNDIERLAERADGSKFLKTEGVYTHFYDADERVVKAQSEKFLSALNCPKFKAVMKHAAATGAIGYDFARYDAVRVGLGLYGYGGDNLTPAMSVYGKVADIVELSAGDTLGYGGAYIAEKDRRIAVISLGYADGVPRAYRGKVYAHGEHLQIVGRVCMDCCFALAGKSVKRGDEVAFIGDERGKAITAERFADRSGLSVYEVLTGFRRIKSVFVGQND
ncbi:MAG: alanine racemase [Clostridia bacterium]|nr:alanine racemase [Clostridia bacterium]